MKIGLVICLNFFAVFLWAQGNTLSEKAELTEWNKARNVKKMQVYYSVLHRGKQAIPEYLYQLKEYNREGQVTYEYESDSIGRPKWESRHYYDDINRLNLSSTKHYHNGKKRWAKQDTSLLDTMRYIYNDSGQLSQSIHILHQLVDLRQEQSYVYDRHNKLARKHIHTKSWGVGVFYKYTNQGKLEQELHSGDEGVIERTQYYYDTTDRLVQIDYVEGYYNLVERKNFTYNSEGKLSSIITRSDFKLDRHEQEERRTLVRDDRGNLIRELIDRAVFTKINRRQPVLLYTVHMEEQYVRLSNDLVKARLILHPDEFFKLIYRHEYTYWD